MYPRRLGAWRPNGFGPQHHASPGGTRSVASVHTDCRSSICGKPLPAVFTTKHTETPFGRHRRRPEKSVLRTCRPCFRLIILVAWDFVPEGSEAKSRILAEVEAVLLKSVICLCSRSIHVLWHPCCWNVGGESYAWKSHPRMKVECLRDFTSERYGIGRGMGNSVWPGTRCTRAASARDAVGKGASPFQFHALEKGGVDVGPMRGRGCGMRSGKRDRDETLSERVVSRVPGRRRFRVVPV